VILVDFFRERRVKDMALPLLGAIHLLGSAWQVVQTAQHAASGNVPAATAQGIKAAASFIPRGGVAHTVFGSVVDQIIVHNNTNLTAHLGNNAVNSIGNNIGNLVDNFGDADGIAEFSDIIEGIGNLFG
jgi:hypothetical protein